MKKNILYVIYLNCVLKPYSKFVIKKMRKSTDFKEFSEEIEYLSHKLDMFPYVLDNKNEKDSQILFDDQRKLFYFIYQGKRLYLNNESAVESYVKGIIREQSEGSPHIYTDGEFGIDESSIIVDAGCAEGNFSLAHIEGAKHVYLIEGDKRWNDALNATFEPWKDKITIINKYLSNEINQDSDTLSNLLKNVRGENVFLKMDLEGYARKTLEGSVDFLRNNNFKVACATYHYYCEYSEIRQFFEKDMTDCKITTTQGYAFPWFHSDLRYPYFRKAMLRAERMKSSE